MKVLLVDDHTLMREGLRAILEKHGLEVVGEAATGRDAIAEALRLHPDVVVMDVTMPDLNGVDAARLLLSEAPDVKVIGLSIHADRRYVFAMFDAGATGYLLKQCASDELLVAVRTVARGERYISPAIAELVLDYVKERRTDTGSNRPISPVRTRRALSGREREVLQLIAEGLSSKEIANRLGVSLTTIETHRRQIMDKLGLRSVAELTKFAIREGLTPLD